MIKIDKGIPIPDRSRRMEQRKSKYPVRDMVPGDSMLIPDIEMHTVQGYTSRWRMIYGWEFTAKAQANGIRVWRVS